MGKLDALKQEIGKTIKRLGYDLYDLEYVVEKKRNILRVLIDNDKGVSIDDCVRASHAIDPVLDSLDPFPDEYTLEVSSPGAERELRNQEEIKKSIGRYIHIETYEQKLEGTLMHFDGDTITICDKYNKQVTFDYLDVNLIRLAVKL